jgi:ketosteroid isomerase-like protein
MDEAQLNLVEAVEAVNARFYDAMENSDLAGMSAVWLHEDWVKCVHPGWDLITGWEDVIESWERIFEGGSGMRVAASDIEVRIEGAFAIVNCYENLAIFLDNRSAPVSARTAATNLFKLVGSQWLMVHHHASQTPDEPTITESDLIQ